MKNINCRVELFTVNCTNPTELTDMQKKLNQWNSTGILVKTEKLAIGNGLVLFTVTKLKG